MNIRGPSLPIDRKTFNAGRPSFKAVVLLHKSESPAVISITWKDELMRAKAKLICVKVSAAISSG